MTLALLVYLAGMFDKLVPALFVMIFLLALGSVFTIAGAIVEESLACKKISKFLVAGFIFCGMLAVMIPTEKTTYMMAGAYAAQKIAESPKTAEVGDKVMKIINQKLDSIIEEGIKKSVDKVKEAAAQ